MIRQATKVDDYSGKNAERTFHQQRHDINTYPCIVACGYRHVLIRKTRRTFPAWLIAFDDSQRNIAWRTKHDFLILQRSIKSTSIQLSKTSLSKLADAAPWVAPSMEVTAAVFVDAVDGEAAIINNWERKMQKNLLQINQFMQKCCASKVEPVSSAWKIFARPGNSEHVMDPRSCSIINTCNEQDEQQSHELGQYFCSSENASFLIDKCFEQIRSRFGAGDDSVSNKPDIVFVEPSVGRGDIVAALCSRLQQDGHSISNQTIQILGFDLDASAVDHCRQQEFAGTTNGKLAFATADFLQTHRRDHVSSDNAIVVFVGNPPFVAHGEINGMPQSQQQPERNICLRFIQHALLEWNAQLVAFIMPQRFRCCDYSAVSLMSSMTLQWETLELPSKRFFFQGNVAVQQPAILQCFWSENKALKRHA
ncbi:hypothetical protein MPSEU_000466100 [Mayamaea pseudoterrestris]|nr:hypothetical protein MPSEU_000465500 [Mayamaea pseudoterrestris]GKY95015.1 hypothetical protein MPSEU_000466100 [Mayamaea pseudoterrestris]